MPTLPRTRTLAASLVIGASLLGTAVAAAQAAQPDNATDSEVSSGQRAIGITHTRKSKNGRTGPEQPAAAHHAKVQPSQRLPDEPNQIKDQVAPVPDTPITPGSTSLATPHV